MSRFAATQEIGNTPPPSALPSMYMSGVTPSQSQANTLPVRPKPVWISSATNKTFSFYILQELLLRNQLGMLIPASPWIGSKMNAAVFGVIAALTLLNHRKELQRCQEALDRIRACTLRLKT